jgi:hypothetical protein
MTQAFIFDVDAYEAKLKSYAKLADAAAVLENMGRTQSPDLSHMSQESQVATVATGISRVHRGGEREGADADASGPNKSGR